jgi:hypothetical protein
MNRWNWGSILSRGIRCDDEEASASRGTMNGRVPFNDFLPLNMSLVGLNFIIDSK